MISRYQIYHYWLRFIKTSFETKDLTKTNHKTTEKIIDEPVYNIYWEIELDDTISKKSQNIGVALFIQIWSHECYIKCLKIFSCSVTFRCRANNWPGEHMVNILMLMFWWSILPTRMIMLRISNLHTPFSLTNIGWFTRTNSFINLACKM